MSNVNDLSIRRREGREATEYLSEHSRRQSQNTNLQPSRQDWITLLEGNILISLPFQGFLCPIATDFKRS